VTSPADDDVNDWRDAHLAWVLEHSVPGIAGHCSSSAARTTAASCSFAEVRSHHDTADGLVFGTVAAVMSELLRDRDGAVCLARGQLLRYFNVGIAGSIRPQSDMAVP
jgi:hypothetical protein